jgi:hypothetical protein
MKDIKTFYTINDFDQHPRIEEIHITEVTIENGKIFFDGIGEDGRWVGFNEKAIGTEFFVNLCEAAKKYSEYLMCIKLPNEDNTNVAYDYFNETMNVGK